MDVAARRRDSWAEGVKRCAAREERVSARVDYEPVFAGIQVFEFYFYCFLLSVVEECPTLFEFARFGKQAGCLVAESVQVGPERVVAFYKPPKRAEMQ